MTLFELAGPDGLITLEAVKEGDGFRVRVGGKSYFLKLRPGAAEGTLVAEISDKPVKVSLKLADGQGVEITLAGERLNFRRQSNSLIPSKAPSASTPPLRAVLVSPMPGRVIGLMAKGGDEVEVGDPLVVIESMKMETAIRSDRKGTVEEILVNEGATVKRGQALLKFRG